MPTDRYVLEDRVVSGDQWSSWRATDTVLRRHVGVLVVTAEHPRRAQTADRARQAACVTDAGLLHIYDVVDPGGGDLLVVSEWASGETLADRLLAGPLPATESCALGLRVARALHVAHAGGVRHGSVGLADVWLTEDGHPKLAGLATTAALEPGAAEPPDSPDSADSWGALAVTYAAVTGRWPSAGRNGSVVRPRQVRAGVPKELDQALSTGLANPPDDIHDVVLSLEHVLGCLGRRAEDRSAADHRGSSRTTRRGATTRVGVLAIVAALAAAAWVGFLLVQDDSADQGRGRAPGGSPSPTSSALPSPSAPPDQTGRVPVQAGIDFDPGGNGREKPELVPLAFDGNLATAWRTVSYAQADLAPKPGVGVVFDLGRIETVGAVRLNLVGAGTTLEVRVAPTLRAAPEDFTPFGSAINVGELVALRAPDPVQARYVLVWLTELPADGTTYRGGIIEITVARA